MQALMRLYFRFCLIVDMHRSTQKNLAKISSLTSFLSNPWPRTLMRLKSSWQKGIRYTLYLFQAKAFIFLSNKGTGCVDDKLHCRPP